MRKNSIRRNFKRGGKRLSKKRVSKKCVSKKRVSKKRVSKKRVSKKYNVKNTKKIGGNWWSRGRSRGSVSPADDAPFRPLTPPSDPDLPPEYDYLDKTLDKKAIDDFIIILNNEGIDKFIEKLIEKLKEEHNNLYHEPLGYNETKFYEAIKQIKTELNKRTGLESKKTFEPILNYLTNHTNTFLKYLDIFF